VSREHPGGWRAALARRVLALIRSHPEAKEAQYGSPTKMKVVPVTIGALAPTKETLASLT
jgi:hypothetical protein